MSTIFTVIITIAVFMVIILIHEIGHFIAAKGVGVKVHEFSIGFGPAIFKRQGKETLYSVRALPIGGYVKLEGEDESSSDPGALNNKPVWARLIVMAAGAIFNLILGFIVFFIISANIPQISTLTIDKINTEIPNSPAAGILQEGDEIVALNGKRLWYYKDLFFLMSTEVGESPVNLTINREGTLKDVTINPIKYEGRYIIGTQMKTENMTFGNAFKFAIAETFFIIRLVFYSIMMLLSGKVPITEMSGPIGAGTMIGSAAKQGLPNLFNIFALLSVNIGIFNLIPFPALDGGRIFFLFIEMIRRKPLPPEREGVIHFTGLVLLLLLMVVVTSSDIYKIFLPKG